MANYVVITKLQKDLDPQLRDPKMPDNWPGECEEFNTPEAAAAKYPGKQVFTILEYKHFKAGLDLGYALLPLPKSPWWKFWSKK